MQKIKWTLTVERRFYVIKGKSINRLEYYDFDNMEDATDTKHHINEVGVLDEMNDDGTGISYYVIDLKAITQD